MVLRQGDERDHVVDVGSRELGPGGGEQLGLPRRRRGIGGLHQPYATRSSTASRRPTTRNARSIWLM